MGIQACHRWQCGFLHPNSNIGCNHLGIFFSSVNDARLSQILLHEKVTDRDIQMNSLRGKHWHHLPSDETLDLAELVPSDLMLLPAGASVPTDF